MNARTIRQGESRLVGLNEFCCYIGLGANKAREFAREHGIEIRIGRACRYDLRKADEAINALADTEKG